MTMIRPPANAPAAPRSSQPGAPPVAGVQVRVTIGGQLLGMLAVVAGALILPEVAPGMPAVSYLAATAAVLVIGSWRA